VHAVEGFGAVGGASAEAVFVEEGAGLVFEGFAVAGAGIGAVGVEGFVPGDEVRVVAGQPGHEPVFDARAQVEDESGDASGAGFGQLTEEVVQLVGGVGEPRENRGDHHPAREAGVADGPDQVQATADRWDTGLEAAPELLVT